MAIQGHAGAGGAGLNVRVMFRTDASLQIGTGHVMRCLTLADALAAKGAECEFICREHAGNLIEHIHNKGYVIHSLPFLGEIGGDLPHSSWLGATQLQDAEACEPVLAQLKPDWLVVDHYALDAKWEDRLGPYCGQLMVIDDLADRTHVCKLLLDQTFGRAVGDYRVWVPDDCTLLCGSEYALLRPEFAALRPYSLQRRAKPELKKLLVTLGGVDSRNVTSRVLKALQNCPLPADCEIIVVMGSTAPWLAEVEQQACAMPWRTTLLVGVNNMAQLMADCDLAIGAAGATSWERCCLGVPTIMLVLAENQRAVARGLEQAGAARLVELDEFGILQQLRILLIPLATTRNELAAMSAAASGIVGGYGVNAVIEFMDI